MSIAHAHKTLRPAVIAPMEKCAWEWREADLTTIGDGPRFDEGQGIVPPEAGAF
jgi:hypothetical protein